MERGEKEEERDTNWNSSVSLILAQYFWVLELCFISTKVLFSIALILPLVSFTISASGLTNSEHPREPIPLGYLGLWGGFPTTVVPSDSVPLYQAHMSMVHSILQSLTNKYLERASYVVGSVLGTGFMALSKSDTNPCLLRAPILTLAGPTLTLIPRLLQPTLTHGSGSHLWPWSSPPSSGG